MLQENDKKHTFANFLYNEFLKCERRDNQYLSLYFWNTLENYAKIGLRGKVFTEQRQYVFKLYFIIREAVAGWNTHLLILRGNEGKKDFYDRMEKYENRLRAIVHDEQAIIQMLDYKIRLNYGND